MTAGRIRILALTIPAAAAVLSFAAWAQAWVLVALDDGRMLAASGDAAAPAVPSFALSLLAVVGALALAGVVFRMILGALAAILGVCIVLSGVLALVDPVRAAAGAITQATGIEGLESVRGLVEGAAVSAWPWVAIVAGAIVVVAGIGILGTASRWPARTRRYDAVRTENAEPSAGAGTIDSSARLDAWDALNDGDDPTAR